MTAFKLENFGGIRPRVSARLLPNNAAVTAENTKLLEGELRGYHNPSIYQDLSSFGFTVGRAYRIPASVTGGVDAWMAWQSPNTDIVRSPVLNDTYNRYYWASDSAAPMYNTLARIVAGNTGANAPWLLGVPQPAAGGGSGLTLGATGGSGVTETRSYVYTFVTAYNEEGPPCNPSDGDGILERLELEPSRWFDDLDWRIAGQCCLCEYLPYSSELLEPSIFLCRTSGHCYVDLRQWDLFGFVEQCYDRP